MSYLTEVFLFSIRPATENDIEAITACDPLTQTNQGRLAEIRRAIQTDTCYVAVDDSILGYGIFDYSFYEYGFVALLVVKLDSRRGGVGTALMDYIESVCQTAKLFTSTNLSNLAMQQLLAKAGYKLSGVIQDLDEGDPELVYVKYIQSQPTIPNTQ